MALRAIFAWYRDRGRELGVLEGRTGSITVVQRAGSACNLNIHFHCLVLDGVYSRDPKTGALVFRGVPPPTQEEIASLVQTIADRAERWLARKGNGGNEEETPFEEDPDDAQVLLMAASMEGRSALRGRRTRRRGIPRNPEDLPQRCAAYEGYNLHAGVRISSRERPALERLCRYVLRPPLSKARLEETTEGDIRLTLKRPWSSGPGRGTAEMHFTRQEFLERLCALVPPPKSNTIIYNGVLAAHSALRSEVVPVAPPQPHPKRPGIRLVLEGTASAKSRA